MSEEIVFTLFYLILSVCIIYPPTEFVSAGFTIPHIFSNILKSEDDFINYHIRKSIVTLAVYSLLPLGYVVCLFLAGFTSEVTHLYFNGTIFWKIFFTTSIILPILALVQLRSWTRHNYKYHPIAINLSKFCNNNNADWKSVAADITSEFRRIDKICITTNPITKIVATENWILKVTPFTVHLAHQSDSSLVVKQADVHRISSHNQQETVTRETQYLNIEVKSGRPTVQAFDIRINASDFKDLEDRVARSITVLPNVKFHKTVVEQFVDVFKETIKNNPRYRTEQELENCIGCMQVVSNVKLQKCCEDDSTAADNNRERGQHQVNQDSCGTCYCRPMWCVECMAKWFASRQESDQPGTWLSSKCTCPMCRSKFCMLDVCLINNEEP